jgi:putative DNA primase/helicase
MQNAPKSATKQFLDAIASEGITPPDMIISDGKRHYFSSNGKRGDSAGWYIFHEGIIATGAFGDFRSGRGMSAWAATIGRELSPDEVTAFRIGLEQARMKREAETAQRRLKAKSKAAWMLKNSLPAPDTHTYLKRKGVRSHGLRLWNNALAVPMIDETGEVQSLQLISPDGDKKFLTGGRMQGCYFVLGKLRDAHMVLIAEGYATAATVHEVTGHPVVVAYNAGNLLGVSQTIRAQHPHLPIYLCADDDYKTNGNPGRTKAKEAALAVGGEDLTPEFGDNRPDGATDFNDMAKHVGKAAVTVFFTSHFLKRMTKTPLIPPNESSDVTTPGFSRPTLSRRDYSPPREPTEVIAPSTPPFSLNEGAETASAKPTSNDASLKSTTDEFEVLQNIWKSVPGEAVRGPDAEYHIALGDDREVVVRKDRIELPVEPDHRPDEAYAAACEHARHFWEGKMEVSGDPLHCLTAWAYATSRNIEVTNYTPNEAERLEADKIIARLRAASEPTFRRPSSVRASAAVSPAATP